MFESAGIIEKFCTGEGRGGLEILNQQESSYGSHNFRFDSLTEAIFPSMFVVRACMNKVSR
jgi:hypothetical protein